MSNERLAQAVQLIRSGQKEQAHSLLLEIIQDDPGNEKAWLWLADTMDSQMERIHTLQRYLKINPGSVLVRKAILALQNQPPAAPLSPAHEKENKAPLPSVQQEPAWDIRPPSSENTEKEQSASSQPEIAAFNYEINRPGTSSTAEPAPKPRHRPRRKIKIRAILLSALILVIGVTVVYVAWKNYYPSLSFIPSSAVPISEISATHLLTETAGPSPTRTPRPTLTATLPAPTALPTLAPPAIEATRLPVISASNIGNLGLYLKILPIDNVLAYADNGRWVVGINGNQVMIWDLDQGRAILTFQGHAAPVTGANFSKDGRILATGAPDFVVNLWETQTGRFLSSFAFDPQEIKALPEGSGDLKIVSVALSPDGNRVAAGTLGLFYLWDIQSGQILAHIQIPSQDIADPDETISFSFTQNGQRLAVEMNAKTYLINAQDGTTIREISTGPDTHIGFSRDGNYLLAAYGASYSLLNGSTGEGITTYEGSIDGSSFAFSPNSRSLAFESGGETSPSEVKIWDIQTNQEIAHFNDLKEKIQTLGFSPDGKLFLVADQDQALIYDLQTRQIIKKIENYAILSFLPDGKRIIAQLTGSADILAILP